MEENKIYYIKVCTLTSHLFGQIDHTLDYYSSILQFVSIKMFKAYEFFSYSQSYG